MKRVTQSLLLLLVCLFSVQLWAQTTDEVFSKTLITKGDYDSEWWRIPAITTAGDGSLVAVFDKRGASSSDLPNTITLVSMRSEDNGRTWSEPVVVAEGNSSTGKTYGDAALLLDKTTNDIFCLYVGDRGFFESTATNRAVIYYSKSSDNGKTWSAPTSLNDFIYKDTRSAWKAAFVASGTGLQLSTGRLMFVMCVRPGDDNGDGFVDNWVLYSDNHGETWNVSETRATDVGNEAKLVELDNGDVLMSIRNHSKGYRLFCKSTDGGINWGTSYLSDDLKDTDCNGDIIRYRNGEHNYLIHSLPNSASERKDVSVFLSDDEGETWSIYRQLVSGNAAYSSLTVLPNGTIGCLIEEGGYEGFNIVFHNFTIDWLLNGQSNGAVLVDGYRIPEGTMHSQGNAYVESIYTTGATTNINQTYSSTPDNVYQLVQETIEVNPGQSFNLYLNAKNLGNTTVVRQDLRYNRAVIFVDWEGDGSFAQEAVYGEQFSGANTPANYAVVMNINQAFTVPADASLGRARIRVIYQNAWQGLPSANAINIYEGMAYDLPVSIVDEEGGGETGGNVAYATPSGNIHSGRTTYVERIRTEGAEENVDQSWTSAPGSVYQMVEKTVLVQPGATFNLYLDAYKAGEASSTTAYQDLRYTRAYIYTDWNRDGAFTEEQVYGVASPQADANPNNVLANYNTVMEINQSFTVPANASLGESRIRVIYHNAWESLNDGANSTNIKEGMAYDIAAKVYDPTAIGELESENNQLYYANGKIYTNVEGEIAVYDLSGKLVRRAQSAPVAVDDLAGGVYIVKMGERVLKFEK